MVDSIFLFTYQLTQAREWTDSHQSRMVSEQGYWGFRMLDSQQINRSTLKFRYDIFF